MTRKQAQIWLTVFFVTVAIAIVAIVSEFNKSPEAKFEEATSNIRLENSKTLEEIKSFSKAALEEYGILVDEIAVSAGWLDGKPKLVVMVLSKEITPRFFKFEVESSQKSLIVRNLELPNKFPQNYKSIVDARVYGDTIVLVH